MDDWPYKSSTDLWCQPIKYPVSISIFRFSNSLHFGRSVPLSLLFALSKCKFVCSVRFAESKVKLFNLFGHYTLFGTFKIMNELLLTLPLPLRKREKAQLTGYWKLPSLSFSDPFCQSFSILFKTNCNLFSLSTTHTYIWTHTDTLILVQLNSKCHTIVAKVELFQTNCERFLLSQSLGFAWITDFSMLLATIAIGETL